MITGNSCDYCGFVPGDPYSVAGQDAMHVRAARHATETIAALTDFSIVAYRYVWEPTRSRLELRAEKVISLGDARDFFNSIVWADQVFGQYRNGTGTELNITVTYRCKGIKKTLDCTIPTVKSDNFWRFGISLDTSFRLKLYLGSGKKFIETAPIALNLK